jgi:hypothetical protein
VSRVLAVWVALTALICTMVYARAHVARAAMPSATAQRWALESLDSACSNEPLQPPPADALSYRAPRLIALAWSRGRVLARHVGGSQLADTVQKARVRFAADPELRALPGCSGSTPPDGSPSAPSDQVRFTLVVDRGHGTLIRRIPLLSNLSVVPLVEGLHAELDGKHAYVTPDELVARRLFDHVATPIPDLALGVDLVTAFELLAEQLGTTREQVELRADVERFVAGNVLPKPYPRDAAPTAAELERAARQGAEFLLRHMYEDGRYAYLYDGNTDERSDGGQYNLPRHAGTTYFLAQADRLLDMPEARRGALSALRWIMRERLTRCGGEERMCVIGRGGMADMGSAALTAIAVAEVLRRGEDPTMRKLLVGLLEFIRSMQRPDGELMHLYDLAADQPIDVQKMYYSGEAAYALLRSHEVLKDPRNLETARRLMKHLTGAGWSFFGSRYFYGEEHWTCQAVSQAGRLLDMKRDDPGLDFCLRWLAFQRALLYGRGQTPWPVSGAIGVGPVILPRVTTVSSRTETAAMLYPVVRKLGLDAAPLAHQVEASLGFLLRMRWAPGPAHMLFDPAAALGGVPGSPASLEVRNDFVQHAGSAMLLWVEALRERGPQAATTR